MGRGGRQHPAMGPGCSWGPSCIPPGTLRFQFASAKSPRGHFFSYKGWKTGISDPPKRKGGGGGTEAQRGAGADPAPPSPLRGGERGRGGEQQTARLFQNHYWKPLAEELEGRRAEQSALKLWGRTGDAIRRPQSRGTQPCHELAGSQRGVCWHRELDSILGQKQQNSSFPFLPP